MMLHPLPSEAKCPYCGNGGLGFVRQRGSQGDLYRCTAAAPCKKYSLHHRRNRGACGVSAVAAIGHLLHFTECPGQEPASPPEMSAE
jgi:ssDNA-binding Zn-finger/Zn-ribbon topoisomerase 1